jgi:hypothetical protein
MSRYPGDFLDDMEEIRERREVRHYESAPKRVREEKVHGLPRIRQRADVDDVAQYRNDML